MQYPLKQEPMRYRGSGFPPYIRRMLKWKQMDLEYTFWQMYLMCVNPKVVYRHTQYRKQTKNRWARDDPAFVAVTCVMIAIITTLYCAFYAHSAAAASSIVFRVVFVDFIGVGALIATAYWLVSNRFLRGGHLGHSHAVEQRVEWLYAFDVHCDAFFSYFLVAYVLHYLVLPVALGHSIFALIVANALHLAAVAAYCYITHLGFRALPFLRNTEVFLYPVVATAAAFLVALALGVFGVKLNSSRVLVAAVLAPLST